MLHAHYNLVTNWLHLHPHWGGVVAFIIAFAESVAVIGSIVPGSVTMTAVGVLIGAGVLPIWATIIWAIAGAFVGDGLSYLLGRYFKNGIRRLWPFSYYPGIIATGETFFFKHGGKSIFIGRFVGPVRAIIPVIAGMLNLPPRRYFIVSAISAISWAPIYMLPGILLGTISLEMPADVAAELIIFILLLLVAIWVIAWVIKKVYQKTHNFFAIALDRQWRQWLQQPSKQWICILLQRADRPYSYGQLFAGSIMLLAILLFFFVFILVVTHSTIIGSNNLVYHLLRGLRTPTLDKIMVVITSFGYYQMLIPVILVIFLYLILQRRWLPAVHWVVGAVLVSGSILFCKIIYFSPRPPGLLHSPITSSFPSGHTAMAIVIYGLLAFFIARNLMRGWRKFVYWIAAVVCGLIAFSRLYLGVHWLTDVLGGICLGVAILSFMVISYRRYKPVILSSLGLFIVAVVTIAISNGYFLHENYAKRLHDLQRYWPTRTVAIQAWWQGDVSPPIILYRTDRFGRPTKMLNLQWAGPLAKIRATLKLHGWQDFHVDSYAAAMKQLLAQTDLAKHRPLLAKLYEDQPPVLEMIKYSTENGSPLIIRLWQSHILLSPGNIPLWIGAVDYDVLSKHFLFFYHKTSLISATHKASQLFATLHNYTWQIKTLKSAEIPTNLRKQHTIFSVLMVKPR